MLPKKLIETSVRWHFGINQYKYYANTYEGKITEFMVRFKSIKHFFIKKNRNIDTQLKQGLCCHRKETVYQ
jgi:hypothetical protein